MMSVVAYHGPYGNVVHCLPVDDLVMHDEGVDCVCGPEVEYMVGQYGAHGKLITHHSLDGRELVEDDGRP